MEFDLTRCQCLAKSTQRQCQHAPSQKKGDDPRFCSIHQQQRQENETRQEAEKKRTIKQETEKETLHHFVQLWNQKQKYYNDYSLPTDRYPLTQRPVIQFDDYHPLVNEETRFLFKEGHVYLPVIRLESYSYASATESVKTEKSIYCGKFFFFEPQSEIVLDLGKTMFFPSKHTCAQWLYKTYDHGQLDFLNQEPILGTESPMTPQEHPPTRPQFPEIMDDFHYDDDYGELEESYPWWVAAKMLTLPPDRRVLISPTPDLLNYYHHFIEPFYDDFPNVPSEIKIHPLYGVRRREQSYEAVLHKVTSFYPSINISDPLDSAGVRRIVYLMLEPGIDDRTDQYICLVGRYAGFETFLFQHEIGERNSVSEILDMRKFPHSHLHQIPPQTLKNFGDSPFRRLNHPTPKLNLKGDLTQATWNDPYLARIWFPSDGVLIGGHFDSLVVDTNKPSELLYSNVH